MSDDEKSKYILTNKDLPVDIIVKIFSLAGIIVPLICKSNEVIPINSIVECDLYWRNLLMDELCINLSDTEISVIEEETKRLRSIHPNDKSLRRINYMNTYRFIRRNNDISFYCDSYLLFRLSVRDAVKYLKKNYRNIVLKSIMSSVIECGNLLGCMYLVEEQKMRITQDNVAEAVKCNNMRLASYVIKNAEIKKNP